MTEQKNKGIPQCGKCIHYYSEAFPDLKIINCEDGEELDKGTCVKCKDRLTLNNWGFGCKDFEKKELQDCPFCGGTAMLKSGLKVFKRNAINTLTYWVVCLEEECCANGPLKKFKHDAVKAWNSIEVAE